MNQLVLLAILLIGSMSFAGEDANPGAKRREAYKDLHREAFSNLVECANYDFLGDETLQSHAEVGENAYILPFVIRSTADREFYVVTKKDIYRLSYPKNPDSLDDYINAEGDKPKMLTHDISQVKSFYGVKIEGHEFIFSGKVIEVKNNKEGLKMGVFRNMRSPDVEFLPFEGEMKKHRKEINWLNAEAPKNVNVAKSLADKVIGGIEAKIGLWALEVERNKKGIPASRPSDVRLRDPNWTDHIRPERYGSLARFLEVCSKSEFYAVSKYVKEKQKQFNEFKTKKRLIELADKPQSSRLSPDRAPIKDVGPDRSDYPPQTDGRSGK